MMIEVVENRAEWDDFVRNNGGHPLQLWAWGELKEQDNNWSAHRLKLDKIGGAQVLIRKLPKPFKPMAYIPRGPIVTDVKERDKTLDELSMWEKEQGSMELKIEPDWLKNDGVSSWKKSKNRILIEKTICIDLSQNEEEILERMDAKTRQNVRRSLRYGVSVRLANEKDFEAVMAIYKETAKRANFALHTNKYYRDIMELFGDNSRIYIAEREGRVISFVWCVVTPRIAFELYGGMNDDGRKYRANFALKWLAMLAEKAQGTHFYDMNGLLSGGVSDFKRGFAPEITEWIGTYDKPLSPLYNVYEKALPTGKKLIQKIYNR